jgi:hypothetical protein
MPIATHWSIRGRELSLERPLVMGIVNVTPDSFSDGGRFLAPGAALALSAKLIAEGADILDVGGESTRPQGATAVSADEELRRVLPVIRTLAAERPEVVLSVDTVKASVAEAALAAGAHIVNDVSGMRLDAEMGAVCASARAGVILMHSRGGVSDMGTYAQADYEGDFLDAMMRELGIACATPAAPAWSETRSPSIRESGSRSARSIRCAPSPAWSDLRRGAIPWSSARRASASSASSPARPIPATACSAASARP